MALDTYKRRKIEEVVENKEIKKMKEIPTLEELLEQAQKLKEFIETLPKNDDDRVVKNPEIDIQWVKEHEGAELKSIFNKQNTNDSEKNNDDEDIDEYIAKLRQRNNTTSNQDDISGSEDNSTPSEPVDEVSLTEESMPEPMIIEEEKDDEQELINELSTRIDKKYQIINREFAKMYKAASLQKEIQSFAFDLRMVMDIKDNSVEELQKTDKALDELTSRLARLLQRAEEALETDNFRTEQQVKQLRMLEDYQNDLENRYGKYWFAKITETEKERYIELYSFAHKIGKEEVEKMIEQSVVEAYKEKVANAEQQNRTPEFKGNYEHMITFNGREALKTLKQIYENLGNASPEQVEEFKRLYSALSALSKVKPKSYEEEQEKLTNLFDITDEIDKLNSSLETVGKSR